MSQHQTHNLLIGSGVFEMEPVIRGIFKARGTLKIELLDEPNTAWRPWED